MVGTPLELIAVEVRADLGELERRMPGAARIVDRSMDQVERSVLHAERTVRVSSTAIARSFDQVGQRSRLLGYQISDIGTQLASGTSPFIVLAQQAPQVANALEGTAGAAGRLAAFFSGPWGAALLAAGSILGVLLGKVLETKAAAEGAAGAMATHKDAADLLNDAIAILDETTGRNVKTEKQLQIEHLNAAIRAGEYAIATRNLARAQLELAQAYLTAQKARSQGTGQGADIAAIGLSGRFDRVNDLQSQIQKLDKAIATSVKSVQFGVAKLHEAPVDSGNGKGGRASSRAAGQIRQIKEEADLAVKSISAMAAELGRLSVIDPQKAADDAARSFYSNLGIDPNEYQKTLAASEAKKDAEFEVNKKVADDFYAQQQSKIQSLASFYEDAFSGGAQKIGDVLKRELIRAVAYGLAQMNVNGGGFGGFISSVGASLGSAFGFASGGSMTLAGRGGTDTNRLSLNGRPIANVSRGETLNIGTRANRGATSAAPQIYVDARGAVMNDQFAQMILSKSARYTDARSAQTGVAAYQRAMKDAPARMTQFSRDGT